MPIYIERRHCCRDAMYFNSRGNRQQFEHSETLRCIVVKLLTPPRELYTPKFVDMTMNVSVVG